MSITAFQPRTDPALEPVWQCRAPTSPLYQRLSRLHENLIAAQATNHRAPDSHRVSAAEVFARAFLAEVFPPVFRFEPGDLIDAIGHQSAALDILVESSSVPSLPALGPDQPRQSLAEGIAAALVVKVDLAHEWSDVLAAAGTLAPLRRNFAALPNAGPIPMRRVPLFAVGCAGSNSPELVKQHLVEGEVDGILIIQPGIFVSSPAFGGVVARGPWALWTFIASLHQAISALAAAPAELLPYAIEKRLLILPTPAPPIPAGPPSRVRTPERTPGSRSLRPLLPAR